MSSTVKKSHPGYSRARTIGYVGVTVALLTVSAWVSIPLGPVPFTLQTFVLAFALLVLRPAECVSAISCYLLLGALGVPVFSGMRGGIGMLLGATGGFLWGFLIGALLALLVRHVVKPRSSFMNYGVCLVALLASYGCGWIQLMVVANMSPLAAFLSSIAPFIVLDLIKLAVAVGVAAAVTRAVPALRKKQMQR